MNKLYTVIFSALFLFACSCTFSEMAVAAPSSVGAVMVRMDGIDPAGSMDKAIEAAKKRAVFKAFSHITSPNNDPNSTFARMMNRYNDYVVSCKLVKKLSSGNGLQAIVDVTVDADRLKTDFSSSTAMDQSNNRSMTARLIVRTTNVSEPDILDEKLVTDFTSCFTGLGFKTQFSAEAMDRVKSTRHLPYQSFEQDILNAIASYDIMVRFAVIGEAKIISIEPNKTGSGYYGKAEITLKSIDVKNNALVGTFTEDYVMLAPTEREAERMAIQKAGRDAAEKMAQQTLDYWKRYN